MKIARVTGNMTSTHRLEAYDSRKLLLVKPMNPDGKENGNMTMAIDYVGAGIGDLVLIGAAPGLATAVFGIEKAPINELIMAIIDDIDC